MLSSLYLCPNENVLFLFLIVHAVLFRKTNNFLIKLSDLSCKITEMCAALM